MPPCHRHMVIATNFSSMFDLLLCSTPQTWAECALSSPQSAGGGGGGFEPIIATAVTRKVRTPTRQTCAATLCCPSAWARGSSVNYMAVVVVLGSWASCQTHSPPNNAPPRTRK